jgi:hypothetical protein
LRAFVPNGTSTIFTKSNAGIPIPVGFHVMEGLSRWSFYCFVNVIVIVVKGFVGIYLYNKPYFTALPAASLAY